MGCPLVIVTWVDSTHPVAAWRFLSDLRHEIDGDPREMVTVGWLLRSDRKVKVLAQSLGCINDEVNLQAGGVMTIPACAVLKVEPLTEKGYRLSRTGKIEKIQVFHKAPRRAKVRQPNRSRLKVVRRQGG